MSETSELKDFKNMEKKRAIKHLFQLLKKSSESSKYKLSKDKVVKFISDCGLLGEMNEDGSPVLEPVKALEVIETLNPFLIPISLLNGFLPELLIILKLFV